MGNPLTSAIRVGAESAKGEGTVCQMMMMMIYNDDDNDDDDEDVIAHVLYIMKHISKIAEIF